MLRAMTPTDLDTLAIDTIRTLSMDAVQQANSGHPGTPMALAPVIYTLWQRHLRYDPLDPEWPGRDRFVLSCGHASMLLYSALFLAGVRAARPGEPGHERLAVSLDEIKRFRQLGSATPGHPEYRHTAGVETTTGPLGQGVATSVGMAMGRDWLAARYDRPGFRLFDHDVWVLCSDGDMMEGISHEAAALAGHLKLSRLCWIYDDNHISIEGPTSLAMSEDVGARFAAYGWDVQHVDDANDVAALDRAFELARRTLGKPSLIVVRSHIAWGSPNKQDKASAHGEPLGAEEVRLAKRAYGWPEDASFRVPDDVREHLAAGLGTRGAGQRAEWLEHFAAYRAQYPAEAAELDAIFAGALPAGWDAALPSFPADAKGLATRDASNTALNAIAAALPWMIGGSADLAPSNKTRLAGAGDLEAGMPGGRNLHFGVREHAMGAIVNGLAVTGLRAFGATFLVFSDYMRGAIRLSAIMQLPVTWVFTHDSIGVGEDGPTHQPIEHLAALRAMPGLNVLRPADANETVEAWRLASASEREPSCLVLTRQALPTFDRAGMGAASELAHGAYVLSEASGGAPQVLLLASGSEVTLCVAAQALLASDGVRARVVSMPSWELFERQSAEYRERVLPAAIRARVGVEMASPFGWDRWVGDTGRMLAMRGFGASGPFPELQKHFGFTAERIVALARESLAAASSAR